MAETDANAMTTAEAIAALEAFVVDNDDLVQLEERIGKFNIFDALGIVRAEIRHSNFLGWLLDPADTHGTGQLFLRAVLMDILHRAPNDIRPLSPVEIDGRDLAGVEVRREQDHIDILIAADDPKIVVAIENKIDSDEHSNQLERYRDAVTKRYPDHDALYVFLTREGDEPSDEQWSPYSYADLHASLSRVRRLNDNAIGDDVLVFLDQYLRMIGSRFMDDPKIDELCDRIYRNHRQALDLIFERKADPRRVIVDTFAECFPADQYERRNTGKACIIEPLAWREIFPPDGDFGPRSQPTGWVRPMIVTDAKGTEAKIEIWVGPTRDPKNRQLLLEAIRDDDRLMHLRIARGRISEQWTTIMVKRIVRAAEGLAGTEDVLDKVRNAAEEIKLAISEVESIAAELFQ